jgi:hypothetical protein
MMRRLRAAGIWNKALVIVTADHGISFDPRNYRRIAYPGDFGGVANPPLFIKYPGQPKGKVSNVHTRTIDILPTIAQVIGVKVPYKTDGRPISEDGYGGKVTVSNGLKTYVTQPLSKVLAERREVLRSSARALGADTGIWQLGPRPELLGNSAPPISGAGGAGTATLDDPGQWSNVRFGQNLKVPAFVVATLDGVPAQQPIAISVNGRVAATCRSFLFDGKTWAGAIVPPQTLQPGQNSIGIYAIGAGGQLTPLGGT